MADGESKWAARVVQWRSSGLSAPMFCRDKDFTATALRYWGTRLKRTGVSKEVRLARIVSTGDPMVQDTAIVIEAGVLRIGVRRGFDPEVLRAVLMVVAGAP
jgi:hypothetical protein